MNGSNADASKQLFKNGVCVLHDVVDKTVLEKCHQALVREKPQHFTEAAESERFYVSTGRYYKTIRVEGPLANSAIILPAMIEQVLAESLGEDFVFDAFGLINALPGAQDQQWHRDGGMLFPGNPLEYMLPVSAVTVAIPLVEMNEESGTTGFAMGTHRSSEPPAQTDFEPIVPVGSAAIWDFRTFHKGIANRSTKPRPLLYATCCRPWWCDVGNFGGGKGMKLAVLRETFDAMDESMQRRFARATIFD